MNEPIRLLVILVFFVVAGVAAGITYKNKDLTFFGMFATFWVIFLLFTIYQMLIVIKSEGTLF